MSTCTVRIMTDEEIWEEKKNKLLANIDAAIEKGTENDLTLALMKEFINSTRIKQVQGTRRR